MATYVGRLLGFHPTDPFEALRAEEIMAGWQDLRGHASKSAYHWELDKDKFYEDRKVFG